jgi:membrane protease YdiL (CAAX protease family)
MSELWSRLPVVMRAALAGVGVAGLGTIPWAALSLANQKWLVAVPWAVAVMAVYLVLLWRWLRGEGWPRSTSLARRQALRANAVDPDRFGAAVLAGMIGFAALVPFTMLLGRMVSLNQARDMTLPPGMPPATGFALIVMAAIVAGFVEEAAFRGYLQQPIEQRHGVGIAIVVTGLIFGAAHFIHHPGSAVLAMLPYYLVVSAVYGMMAYVSNSIWPGVLLHAGGDVIVLSRWWLTGRGEWELTEAPPRLIWETGTDVAFWATSLAFLALGGASAWLFAISSPRVGSRLPDL